MAPNKIYFSSFSLSHVCLFSPLSNTFKSFVRNRAILIWGDNTIPNTGMFGRVRATPSSLDSFETPPSKIIKDDSLSVYEATLMKLKLGSQRRPIQPPTVADLTDICSRTIPAACQEMHSDGESMVMDTDCSSASDCQSKGDLNLNSQQRRIGTSILYLFSKYSCHQRTPTIRDETMM